MSILFRPLKYQEQLESQGDGSNSSSGIHSELTSGHALNVTERTEPMTHLGHSAELPWERDVATQKPENGGSRGRGHGKGH